MEDGPKTGDMEYASHCAAAMDMSTITAMEIQALSLYNERHLAPTM